jgi:beta-galactosidase
VGVTFELAAGFDRADWIGLGPWENYADRRSAAVLAHWSSPISDLAVPYLRPQENGTRSGLSWLEIAAPDARVQVFPDRPIHINVSHHSVADLEAVEHWWELTERSATIVHIDIAHRGVGTGRIGPDTAPEFRAVDRHYEWRWRLRLLTDSCDESAR